MKKIVGGDRMDYWLLTRLREPNKVAFNCQALYECCLKKQFWADLLHIHGANLIHGDFSNIPTIDL